MLFFQTFLSCESSSVNSNLFNNDDDDDDDNNNDNNNNDNNHFLFGIFLHYSSFSYNLTYFFDSNFIFPYIPVLHIFFSQFQSIHTPPDSIHPFLLWLPSSPSAFSIPLQNHFRNSVFSRSCNVSYSSQFSFFNYFKNILILFLHLSNSLVPNFIQS